MGIFGSQQDEDRYTRAIFGADAIRLPCQIILQESGDDRQAITSFVGLMEGESRSENAIRNDFPHELIIGEVIIRPREKYSGMNGVGKGLAGLAKSKHIFPGGWSHKTYPEFHDQWEHENGVYKPASSMSKAS
jgi:hypothetical protein